MITTKHNAHTRAREATGPRAFALHAALYLALCIILLALAPALSGCSFRRADDLTAPRQHIAPYNTARAHPVWAVYPLRNETGTSLAKPADITDAIVAAAAQTRNLRVLPLNRTLEAMAALGLRSLATPEDARNLAEAIGADGIILGSITAFDPYTPTIGLSLALYIRPGILDAQHAANPDLDPRALAWQPTDYAYFPDTNYADAPASAIAIHLDGKNHATQMAVRDYAEGRSDPATALGWRRYLASTPLFTEFAAHHAIGQLLDHEWIRLATTATPRPAPTPTTRTSAHAKPPGKLPDTPNPQPTPFPR